MYRRCAFVAVLAVAAALSCARPACAGAIGAGIKQAVVTLDPALTRVDFTLPGSIHTTRGSFRLQIGTIAVDPQTGTAGGKIIVDASSGDSGDSLRDAHMKGSILEAARYPEIIFVPQTASGHVDPQGAFDGIVAGTLYLHGGVHQISMQTQGRVEGDQISATASVTVPYVEWGMEDPSILFLTVAKSVDLKITAAGHVTWIPATP